jgi:hypothetical protein
MKVYLVWSDVREYSDIAVYAREELGRAHWAEMVSILAYEKAYEYPDNVDVRKWFENVSYLLIEHRWDEADRAFHGLQIANYCSVYFMEKDLRC